MRSASATTWSLRVGVLAADDDDDDVDDDWDERSRLTANAS